jgi:glycosyltransferase involved in cell wall biosynthesis
MEAIGSGCYCLSHAWDGADELVPAGDIYVTDKELIDKILAYADGSLQERSSKREAQLVRVRENFDVDKIKVQIRRLVEEVGSGWM